MTGVGVLLGTAAYVSPEQAAGKPVDKRSDLWAFGVVLMEMLTGHQVFEGETVSHVLASVLKDEPDWTTLPPSTPMPLCRLLRRCLEKDRKRRLHSTADGRLEVEDALTTPASELPVTPNASRTRERLLWLSTVALVTFLAGAATTAWIRERATSVLPPVTRLDLVTPATNDPFSFALSPDGRQIAFVANVVGGGAKLWLMDIRRGVPNRFTFDAAQDQWTMWSPDGRQVVFSSDRKGVFDLFEKAANGATDEQPLLVSSQDKAALDWSPDGRILLYATQDPKTASDLWALPMTGERKPFPVVQTSFDDIQGQFSPDGRWLAHASNESGRYEICIRSFPEGGGRWQVSAAGGLHPRWGRDGHEVFFVAPDTRLMAAPIRVASDTRAVDVGAPVALFPTRLASGADAFAAGFNARAQYMVAPDGRFLMNVSVAESVPAPPITIVENWTTALRK